MVTLVVAQNLAVTENSVISQVSTEAAIGAGTEEESAEDSAADALNSLQQPAQAVARDVNSRSVLQATDRYFAAIALIKRMMLADTVLSSAPSALVNFALHLAKVATTRAMTT